MDDVLIFFGSSVLVGFGFCLFVYGLGLVIEHWARSAAKGYWSVKTKIPNTFSVNFVDKEKGEQ